MAMPVIEIDYCPYDYQVELHDSPARFKVIVGGRRVGKSKMALQEIIKHCIEVPYATAWWVAPTIAMAREVGWDEFINMKEELLPGISTVHDTLMRVRFKNGSTLYFKGGDSEKSLRGRGLTMVVIDEAAFLYEEIWTRALLPALADKQGKAIIISTPNGRNWFYRMAIEAASEQKLENPRWAYWHWPSYKNPMMTEDELKAIASSISEMDFRQEFMGEFVTRGGMVYDEFNEENIIDEGLPSLHDFDIYLGMDFGYANPCAVAFMAVAKDNSQVFMFDELYVTRMKMEDILKEINKKLIHHGIYSSGVKAVYTDPAGNADELSSGISPVDYLRMNGGFHVINKPSRIAPGVALVRAFVRNGNGVRNFFVTKNCREAIRSLMGYTYDKKDGTEVVKEEPFKDGVHDHMCDAIRYFFVNQFDQAKWVAERLEQFEYGARQNNPGTIMKRCAKCRQPFPSSTPKTQPPFFCREHEQS